MVATVGDGGRLDVPSSAAQRATAAATTTCYATTRPPTTFLPGHYHTVPNTLV